MTDQSPLTMTRQEVAKPPRGFSIPQFARYVGVSRTTMERWCLEGYGPKVVAIPGPKGRKVKRITAAAAAEWEKKHLDDGTL